ncbi:hypothetical protein L6164_031776 [Bauhinia variegata]|uniref:Uncharacterized protein n=1 Tax=Bauhinia variegata TaxID=167791 RepID=A0ACB9KLP6_BAUVA|nr:hypothetical protein L6164_031776 [Bauhinia variegata]
MACESKPWLMMLLLAAILGQHYTSGEPQVPCLFIFGDSLSDSGNNNYLPTISKADYQPYGIDFPSGPTGRFTNGRTAVDIITQVLGFEDFIAPFANTSGWDILKGVNYASGSAGIRNESGKAAGADISFGSQIVNHKAIVSRILDKLESLEKTQKLLNKCLYYVNIGSNDYINNYFLPEDYPTSLIYNPEEYAEVLIQQYSHYLKALYELGARKFALIGLGLLGCTPFEIHTHGTNGSQCVEEENSIVQLFNDRLKPLVHQLSEELSHSKFMYVNTSKISSDSSLYSGITETNIGCCPTESYGLCVPEGVPCSNRSDSMGYDIKLVWLAVHILALAATYNIMQQYYCAAADGHGEPQVAGLFIFGDSLSDCGNNNHLKTRTKVNYPPYGIDFPNGPTGRFTNGRTVIDFITQFLGFENLVPPYANTSGWDTLAGVNYASGAAGIRNETGTAAGADISFELQLEHHRVIVSKITEKLGSRYDAQQHLNNCLYYVNIGINDYINNYCATDSYPTKRQYPNPALYAAVLIQQYYLNIRALHELGARKFVLVGILPVVCSSLFQVAAQGQGTSPWLNNDIFDGVFFNNNLRLLVLLLNQELSDSKFIYVNPTFITAQLLLNRGLNIFDACCKTTELGLCVANQTTLCQNRDEYLFWDSFHFTEAANRFIAISSYNASNLFFTFPMDIYHLVDG